MLRNIEQHLAYYIWDEGCTLTGALVYYDIGSESILYPIMQTVTYICCAIFFILAAFTNSFSDRVLAITMILLMLPKHSTRYCLLYIIPYLILFLDDEKKSKIDLVILFALFFIFVPLQTYTGMFYANFHTAIYMLTICLLYKSIICFKSVNKLTMIKKKLKERD